jgi:3-methyladenine DNA glycosylase AlkD
MTKREVLAWLKKKGTSKTLAAMPRYGLVAKKAFGVPVGALLTLKKKIGVDHALANELWVSGWYEARLLAALIGDPSRVTKGEMDRWARHFENWGDVDTVCFKLWDRTPHAWTQATRWSASDREWVKRAGFALMASLARHDRKAPDRAFTPFLRAIRTGATDERNFVKKGVSWALRSMGHRPELKRQALDLARKLSLSDSQPARWVGRDAVRDLLRKERSR